MAFIIFIIVVIVLIAYASIRNNKIKNEGIRANAVISRIEKDESVDDDSVTYHYYVSYEDESGNSQEAMILNNLNNNYNIGQTLTVKYLPDKKNQVVIVNNE